MWNHRHCLRHCSHSLSCQRSQSTPVPLLKRWRRSPPNDRLQMTCSFDRSWQKFVKARRFRRTNSSSWPRISWEPTLPLSLSPETTSSRATVHQAREGCSQEFRQSINHGEDLRHSKLCGIQESSIPSTTIFRLLRAPLCAQA